MGRSMHPTSPSYSLLPPHPTPQRQVVAGALVGGPDSSDRYEDKRSDFQAK